LTVPVQPAARTSRGISRPGDTWWLLGAATIFLAQQISIRLVGSHGLQGSARRAVFVGTTAALVALALRFRRFWGAWLVAAGIAMNLVPMAAHGGSMPIDWQVLHSSGAFPEITADYIGRQTPDGKDVVLERDDIRFYALSDRYVLTLPVYGPNIYSLGDFVLFSGVGLVLAQAAIELAAPALRGRARADDEG
jgi:hypothetical protein